MAESPKFNPGRRASLNPIRSRIGPSRTLGDQPDLARTGTATNGLATARTQQARWPARRPSTHTRACAHLHPHRERRSAHGNRPPGRDARTPYGLPLAVSKGLRRLPRGVRAREEDMAHTLVSEIIEIADDGRND